MKIQHNHVRRNPVLPLQRKWGLYLTDCGCANIGAGETYPPGRHPSDPDVVIAAGRVLPDYQMVYITQGRGVFETKEHGRSTVEAGDVMLLFPGVWHRYHHAPETGWEKQWVGFDGAYTSRLMCPPFYSKSQPVLRVGVDELLRQRFMSLTEDHHRVKTHAPFSSAGRILELTGLIQERLQHVSADEESSEVIREAQNRILRQATHPIDFEELAASFKLSYMTFRRRFKMETGTSPAQFQSSIRIQRAQELLTSTNLSVTEIGQKCGFETIYYFSRHFTQKLGITPSDYRKNR